MSKYDELDDATKSQVDAALEILRDDAAVQHDRTLMKRLDRIDEYIDAQVRKTKTEVPQVDPKPENPPVVDPPADPPGGPSKTPPPKDPPPEKPKRRGWGNYAED